MTSAKKKLPETRALDKNWRQRVREVGKRNFENEEMLRLGFVTAEDLKRAARQSEPGYQAALAKLAKARQEFAKVEAEIAEAPKIEALIAQVRARRIERVKAEREKRREQNAVEAAERAKEVARRRGEEPTFLGRGVSGHLSFTGGDPEAVSARQLPALANFLDLAAALQLTPQQLKWLTYVRGADQSDHYTRFEIPKRSGGVRLISSPKPALRQAQEWVRDHLLRPLPVGPAVAAFRPGMSIVDNAARHTNANVVVRIDLKDFFPSITFHRVRGYFQSLGYNPGVATVLALLCTDTPRARVTLDGQVSFVGVGERALPQGACTSPDLANLIAGGLDARLTGLAEKVGWRYSRYADDLVFSTSAEDADPARLVRAVTGIAASEGFRVNPAKTRVMRSPNRQTVTGLLVNEGVRITRADLRRIRAYLHRCRTRGVDAVSAETGKDALAVARGHLAYVAMVMPTAAARMRLDNPWVRTG